MQVYKAFFKIIYKNLSQIVIYIGIFLFFTIMLTNTYKNPTNTDFTETKVNIAFINYDKDSTFLEGLKKHLNNYANIIDIPNDEQKIQDALFFRQVEYIVRVPNGFCEDFLAGKTATLEKITIPTSTRSIYMDNLINKYLNTAKAYTNTVKNISQEQLINFINNDLSKNTEVVLKSSANKNNENEKLSFYFNYLAYSLFAVLILGVCSVMIVFNDLNLKMRNYSSPLKLKNFNIQMILGNLSFAVLSWFIMTFASFIMFKSSMLSKTGFFLLLNSFVFTIAILSISYLIGNIIKSRNAMSAAANVISLGSCFISGVFVPQELLSKSVLKLASFTPTYWYVKTNNDIVNIVNYNTSSLKPILFNMLIVLIFAIATLAVTLVVIKQKRTNA